MLQLFLSTLSSFCFLMAQFRFKQHQQYGCVCPRRFVLIEEYLTGVREMVYCATIRTEIWITGSSANPWNQFQLQNCNSIKFWLYPEWFVRVNWSMLMSASLSSVQKMGVGKFTVWGRRNSILASMWCRQDELLYGKLELVVYLKRIMKIIFTWTGHRKTFFHVGHHHHHSSSQGIFSSQGIITTTGYHYYYSRASWLEGIIIPEGITSGHRIRLS